MSPRVTPKPRADTIERGVVSAELYRQHLRAQGAERPQKPSSSVAWWKYAARGDAFVEAEEYRVLSKASNAAGNFLVPTDFYDAVMAVARDRGTVAKLAKEITTVDGRPFNVPRSERARCRRLDVGECFRDRLR